MSGPGPINQFAKSAGEMNIPSQYDNKDFGKKVKAVAKKVTIKSSGDGKVYGARAIMTKETQSFLQFLEQKILAEKEETSDQIVTEGDDITLLPDSVLGEIKSNIRAGARDLEQKWKNALELVHKAYQVANIRRPTPDQKGAWKQYEDMIKFGVAQLRATRGIDGDWRMTQISIREAYEQEPDKTQKLGKRRFFVEVPGEAAVEADGKDVGEIIEQLTNKFRRHGTTVRVDRRDDLGAVLSIWKHGIQIDKMVIKELS